MKKEELTSVFQERFEKLIENSGKSEKEIAQEIDLSQSTVNNYRNNKKKLPDATALAKIADTFHVSVDWLLGREPIRSSDLDVKTICKKTGLSEMAVIALTSKFHNLVNVEQISEFISDLRFLEVTLPLKSYKELQPIWTKKVFATRDPDGNIILPPIDTARFYLNEAVDAFRKMLFEDFENDWKEVIEEQRAFDLNEEEPEPRFE